MADWNRLKPLRFHQNFMILVVIGLLCVLIFTPKHAFRKNFYKKSNFQLVARVNAPSGIKIREEPNKNSNPLISVPYQTELNILEKAVRPDKINGQSGQWYKVEYNGVTGFVWNAYLDE